MRTTKYTVALALLLATHPVAGLTADPTRPDVLKDVKRILFTGDSLTDGSSYPDYVVNTLNRIFPAAGFETHNSAVAGDTAAMLRKRFEADVLRRDPDLTLFCIGTNDRQGQRPVNDYKADLEFMVAETLKSGSEVMIVLPSPFAKAASTYEPGFADFLEAMRDVAAHHGLLVADAHAEFVKGEAAGREMLGGDGIHHGKDGFEGMARAIVDALGFADEPLDLEITAWPGLLTAWETSDPVPLDGDYSPAEATGWRPYDAAALSARQPWWNAPFPARGGWMPFVDRDGQRAAYGRAFYDADKPGPVQLEIGGSPSPQIVWVNGEKVWQSGRPHGYHPNADRLTVEMKKGRNEIVGLSNFMLFVGVREL